MSKVYKFIGGPLDGQLRAVQDGAHTVQYAAGLNDAPKLDVKHPTYLKNLEKDAYIYKGAT